MSISDTQSNFTQNRHISGQNTCYTSIQNLWHKKFQALWNNKSHFRCWVIFSRTLYTGISSSKMLFNIAYMTVHQTC